MVNHVMNAVLMVLIGRTYSYPSSSSNQSRKSHSIAVTRSEWGAQPPTATTALGLPVSLVVVHHSFIPGPCQTFSECATAMRSMQRTHQVDNGWADIGYNFAVGGDGAIYEGRGWEVVGAHAAGFNAMSIGIVLIGDFVSEIPPKQQLEALKILINTGVQLRYIRHAHSIVGHRQVGTTECPGDRLFEEISSWVNFDRRLARIAPCKIQGACMDDRSNNFSSDNDCRNN